MAKGIHFNKGILDIKQKSVVWELPVSEVHCVSINELSYLKDSSSFAVPLSHIEHIDKQLKFTWSLPEGYEPITSVKNESTWYKLKTAKDFLAVAKFFEESKDLETVYNTKNFYVDKHYNIKVLFYTNPLHLPYESSETDNIQSIKKILANLFTSINEKKLDTYDKKNTTENEKGKKSGFVNQILASNSINELIQLVDIEYDHYLSLQDERQNSHVNQQRKKQNKSLLVFSGLIVLIIAGWYFTNNIKDDTMTVDAEAQNKQEKLEDINENYENQLASYDAYFAGDIGQALDEAEKVDKDLNDAYYIELLIRNDKATEAMEQFPNKKSIIAEKIALFEKKSKVLDLELDNKYLEFEKALLQEENKKITKIIPDLKEPTTRQKELIFKHYLKTDTNKALDYAETNKDVGSDIRTWDKKKESLEKKEKKLDGKDEKERVSKKIKKVTKRIKSLKEEQ